MYCVNCDIENADNPLVFGFQDKESTIFLFLLNFGEFFIVSNEEIIRGTF